MNSARTQFYVGKSLLAGNICKGMNMEQVTGILADAIELIYTNQSLECLDLNKFGIKCPPESAGDLVCFLLDLILTDQLTLSQRLTQITNFYNSVQTSVGAVSDEKVKVNATSTISKFLEDAIKGTPGRIKTASDTITITGLIPIGARMTISASRKGDFDSSSKGKAGTDLEGWAIRNGSNGLDDAMGRFPMYTDTLDNAGKKAGVSTISVKLANLESFNMSVSGSIAESLTTDIKVKIPLGYLNKRFGVGGARDVMVPDVISKRFESDPLSLKHTHSHTLSVAHTNPQVETISIIPVHIKEIPIEFIG